MGCSITGNGLLTLNCETSMCRINLAYANTLHSPLIRNILPRAISNKKQKFVPLYECNGWMNYYVHLVIFG